MPKCVYTYVILHNYVPLPDTPLKGISSSVSAVTRVPLTVSELVKK